MPAARVFTRKETEGVNPYPAVYSIVEHRGWRGTRTRARGTRKVTFLSDITSRDGVPPRAGRPDKSSVRELILNVHDSQPR